MDLPKNVFYSAPKKKFRRKSGGGAAVFHGHGVGKSLFGPPVLIEHTERTVFYVFYELFF